MKWHDFCTIISIINKLFHNKNSTKMETRELAERALQVFTNTNFELISEYLIATKQCESVQSVLDYTHARQSFLGEQVKLTLLSESHLLMMIVLIQEFHYEVFINHNRFECVFLARNLDESFVINFHMPTTQFTLTEQTIISLSEEAHYWRDGQNIYP